MEEAAEQALALANKDLNRRAELLETVIQRLEAATSVDEACELDVVEEMHLSFYLVTLSEEISTQEKGVNDARLRVEDRRNLAIEARREKQVLEKLKERHRQNHRRETEAREQKEMDELALYSYIRGAKPLQPRLV